MDIQRATLPELCLNGLKELAPPWHLQLMQEGAGAGSRSSLFEARGNLVQIDDWYEPDWDLHRWQPPVESQALPSRDARIATSARRLMALERRRMRRSSGGGFLDRRPRTPYRYPEDVRRESSGQSLRLRNS